MSYMENKTEDNESPILFISYFQGVKGCCPAEWADDKVDAMTKLGKRVILISSLMSKKYEAKGVTHYRIPSLSWTDVKLEYNQLKSDNQSVPYFKLLLTLPFVLTVGVLLELVQKAIISGLGGGKWSWTLPSLAVSAPIKVLYRCKTIFTTGGPASAHLTGLILRLGLGGRLICELQDPLSGKDIGRTVNSARLSRLLEQHIVKISDKAVFVTKSAAREVQARYPKYSSKIVAIYPGSKSFETSSCVNTTPGKVIELIHLGTLYSSRNMYSLIKAIDELIEESKLDSHSVKITNLGDIYGEMREHHLARQYVEQKDILPRAEAISFAASKHISLLVQHADNRSQTTIPYKTYDYINIKNPILGLTNSTELSCLLRDNGHMAVDINDIEAIKAVLLDLVNNYDVFLKNSQEIKIDIVAQTKEILS